MTIVEEWRDVLGYPNYEVSSLARVRRKGSDKCLSYGLNRKGYLDVHLPGAHRLVHCLVAEAFICPRPKGLFVNHIDGDKTNNKPENLEWVTSSENMKHALRIGLAKVPVANNIGEKHPMVKLTKDQVNEIKSLRGQVSQTILAKQYGITQATVSKIQLGQRWSKS